LARQGWRWLLHAVHPRDVGWRHNLGVHGIGASSGCGRSRLCRARAGCRPGRLGLWGRTIPGAVPRAA
jgi:hypothetical protein